MVVGCRQGRTGAVLERGPFNVILHFDVLPEFRASLGILEAPELSPREHKVEARPGGNLAFCRWECRGPSHPVPLGLTCAPPPPIIQQVGRCRCRVDPQGLSAPTQAMRDSPAGSRGLSEGQAGTCREKKVAHGGLGLWARPHLPACGDRWRGSESGPEPGPQEARASLPAAGCGCGASGPELLLVPLSPMGTWRALGAASLKESVTPKARAHLCLLAVAVARVRAPPAVPARTRGLPAPSSPETPPCGGETGAQTGGHVCPKPGSL